MGLGIPGFKSLPDALRSKPAFFRRTVVESGYIKRLCQSWLLHSRGISIIFNLGWKSTCRVESGSLAIIGNGGRVTICRDNSWLNRCITILVVDRVEIFVALFDRQGFSSNERLVIDSRVAILDHN